MLNMKLPAMVHNVKLFKYQIYISSLIKIARDVAANTVAFYPSQPGAMTGFTWVLENLEVV